MIHAGGAAAKLQAAGGVRSLSFDVSTPLQLSSGEILAPLTLAFETYGALNVERTNAVLVAHARAVERFGGGRAAPASQLPLALLMIGYTAFGLWLLAAPTAG